MTNDPASNVERLRAWFTEAILGFFALVMLASVANDFFDGGVYTSSNRRVTSFADSLYSCFRYRMLQPAIAAAEESSSPPNSPKTEAMKKIRSRSFYFIQASGTTIHHCGVIVATALIVKFGSGTVVSIALGEWPVLFHGPRHMVSFLLAFALLQVYLPWRILTP